MRQLIYIGQTPAEGTGSPVIVLRHLRRLATHGGWHITIVAEPGQDTAACAADGWNIVPLSPHRRWWWPPFRDTSPRTPTSPSPPPSSLRATTQSPAGQPAKTTHTPTPADNLTA